MANFNKVILLGNLTRDPQLSYLPSNLPVIEFGMAINRRWRGQDGQMKEEVCFVDCRCYGRSAETINQYVKKGNPLLVEGGVDLLVTDVRMPGFSGLDVLTALRRVSVRCPVVLVTAFGDEALHQFARQLGVVAVLDKPFDVNELTYFASVQRTLSGGAPES